MNFILFHARCPQCGAHHFIKCPSLVFLDFTGYCKCQELWIPLNFRVYAPEPDPLAAWKVQPWYKQETGSNLNWILPILAIIALVIIALSVKHSLNTYPSW